MKLSLRIAILLLTGFSVTSWAGQPNIVVIVADDLGWADVGYHGGPIETPSLDSIASEGLQLDRFYTTPICSPTRAALMTARDPVRLGVALSVIMPWDNTGIHPDEHFMPQSFKTAGYQTAIIGKWHLGHAQQTYHPNERGFEYFYGHLHTEVGYFPPFANQGGKDFQRNGISIDDQGYETYLLADDASRWIKGRDKTRPFFLYMPFIAPHTPLAAPADLQAKYADLKDKHTPARSPIDNNATINRLLGKSSSRPLYAAVVDAMDQAIGRVMKTLEQEGIADDTLILFFSDNGGMPGFGGASNAPLKGGKAEAYEGGIRVVSVIKWPGHLPQGKSYSGRMSVMDVFPTLASAAGVTMRNTRKLDGIDLWPNLVADKPLPRKDVMVFASELPIYGSLMVAAFDDEWKLVQRIEQKQTSIDVSNELFHIASDPYEFNNVADQHPKVVGRLADKVRAWRSRYPANGTRAHLVPPPGWRAPIDWADFPTPIDKLQKQAAPGMPPAFARKILDWQHGENGRLIYDCDPLRWLGGICLNSDLPAVREP